MTECGHIAGTSDKYGQVYVEKIGNTGFSDVTEPVALLRAQDEYAQATMDYYLRLLRADAAVPRAQIDSVERQVNAFVQWRITNADKVRKPGTRA